MKRLLMCIVGITMVAGMLPAQAEDDTPSVGVWFCNDPQDIFADKPDKVDKKKGGTSNICYANVPEFPTFGATRTVKTVGGAITKIEPELEETIEKEQLTSGGIGYTELNCEEGQADGILNIDGEPYSFIYRRVGVTAVVVAQKGNVGPPPAGEVEILIGTVWFYPNEFNPFKVTGITKQNGKFYSGFDPVHFLNRCQGGPARFDRLRIQFTGGGLYLEFGDKDPTV